MKVLLVTCRSDASGGPRHVETIAARLAVHGIEVFVASPADPPFAEAFREHAGPGRHLLIPARRLDPLVLLRLARFMRNAGIDVLHTHGKGAGVLGRLAARLVPGVRVIHTFHGVHVADYGPVARSAYALLERWLSARTARCISVSASEAGMVQAEGLCGRHRPTIVPNGVPIPKREFESRRCGALRVLMLSRPSRAKGLELLPAILEALAPRLPHGAADVQVRIVGIADEGPEEVLEALRSGPLGESVSIEAVQDGVAELYEWCDVLLSTSRWEGHPLAILEAAAAGRPAVASRVVGNVDALVDGETGRLYDRDRPEEAAECLAKLQADRAALAELSRNAREHVRARFDADTMVRSLVALYRDEMAVPSVESG